jgi:hypothetical protein
MVIVVFTAAMLWRGYEPRCRFWSAVAVYGFGPLIISAAWLRIIYAGSPRNWFKWRMAGSSCSGNTALVIRPLAPHKVKPRRHHIDRRRSTRPLRPRLRRNSRRNRLDTGRFVTNIGAAFAATNSNVHYSPSPARLIITQGSTVMSNEAMLEYRSAS